MKQLDRFPSEIWSKDWLVGTSTSFSYSTMHIVVKIVITRICNVTFCFGTLTKFTPHRSIDFEMTTDWLKIRNRFHCWTTWAQLEYIVQVTAPGGMPYFRGRNRYNGSCMHKHIMICKIYVECGYNFMFGFQLIFSKVMFANIYNFLTKSMWLSVVSAHCSTVKLKTK